MTKLFLVDGTAQLFRAYFALPPLTNDDGLPTHAVYGFATMLRKLIRDESPTHLAVAFDLQGPVFRHDAYAEYKANRPPTPEDLNVQAPYAKRVCEVLGAPVLEKAGFEADDLIATYARLALRDGYEVVVVSSDKDLLQLVGERVSVFNPVKNLSLDAAGVEREFGVLPEFVTDVLGLMGDSVDNVPGVPGVGPKTAKAAVALYGDLQAICERGVRFAEAWRARDLLVEALGGADAPAIGATARAAAETLRRLIEVERDEALKPRLESAAALAETTDAGAGKRALSALKREMRGLDRGSAKKAWLSIASNVEQATLSKQLVTLHENVPVESEPGELELDPSNGAAAAALFASLGFRTLVAEVERDRGTATVEPARDDDPGFETVVVDSAEALEQAVRQCRNAGCVAVAVDTSAGTPMRATLNGIAVAPSRDRAYYVTAERSGDRGLASLLGDAALPKHAHDLKRASHILQRHGIELSGWGCDTHVAAVLLNPARKRDDVRALAAEFIGGGIPGPVSREAQGGLFDDDSSGVGETLIEASLVAGLAEALPERLVQAGLGELYEQIEGPLLPVLARMERRGIGLDVSLLETMSEEMDGEITRLRSEIHELAGGEFNVDSPPQLREVLFERLGLRSKRKTAKSKAASTDAQTLEELTGQHEIARRILDYRELTKLKSTYVDALPRLVDPQTRRVHTTYDQTGAATGRLSSSDPNLQNIPVRSATGRRIREAFVPAPGRLFLSSDYSQIELRVLAHLSDDPELIAAFREGQDIHRHTASRIFDVPAEDVDKEMRRRAKAINFGVLYGMSETRLAREQRISRDDARRFISAYFDRFERVAQYIDDVREQARRDAAVRTLFGRVRLFPELHRQTHRGLLEQALRGAVNTTIQGTAADLMKLAMLAVDGRLAGEADDGARILLQVHDELLLEVPADRVESISEIVREAMEQVHELVVPLVVDQKCGKNWLAVG